MRGLIVLLVILIPVSLSAESKNTLQDTGLVCAVDMGSNTFKFIVAEIKDGKYFQYVDDRKTAGVADDLKNSEKNSGQSVISEGKLNEIKSLLKSYQDECERRTHSRKIYAIATAAFREAANIKTVSEEIHQQGVEMQVLSGEEESIYAYNSATSGEPGFAVVDLGSRTTEFVSNIDGKYQWEEIATGYKVAWDDFYDQARTFGEASAQHTKRLEEVIGEHQTRILGGRPELRMIEIGEAASFILGIPQSQIEGKVITHSQVKSKLKELLKMDAKSFQDFKKNFSDASRVLPRLVVADLILNETDYDAFRATNRELNVAIIYKRAKVQTN